MASIPTIRFSASEHPVKSVLVLKSSKAEIVRTFDVGLKMIDAEILTIIRSGQNKVVISQLSSTIDTESVRISGLNSSAAKSTTYLSDVVCSVLDISDDAADGPIEALEAKKAYLAREKKVLDTQAEVLVKYSNSLDGTQASPDVMTTFLNAFVDQAKANIKVVAKLETEIAAIDKQIKEEKKQASLLKGSANAEVIATITADAETLVNLKLIYIVNQTNWSPTYELHAVTGDDGRPSQTVALHYRASVVQTTGEDWTDASLTLSTAAIDAMVKVIPKPTPVWIRVVCANAGRGGLVMQPQQVSLNQQIQQMPIQQLQQMPVSLSAGRLISSPAPSALAMAHAQASGGGATGRLYGTAPSGLPGATQQPSQQSQQMPAPSFSNQTQHHFASAPALQAQAFGSTAASGNQADLGVIPFPEEDEEGTEDGDEGTPTKLVNQTPMALTYVVHGRSSIPSDGKQHVVTIAMLSFKTDIDYVSVPRVDPRVYLQCQVKNNSEYRLLPGPVSVILDDSYVSKTTISDVNRNDVFNFTLGDDPSVLISYARLSKVTKEGSGSFADVTNVTTYTVTIKVQNKHPFPIDNLIIRNALPVTEDKRVRVVLKKPKELIEAKEGVLVKVGGEGAAEDEESCPKVKWTKEKTGLYEYHWRVDGDDKIELETVFEMKASTDLVCTFDEGRPFCFGASGKKNN